jgi:Reverse transcriptase (RNA-dependent DNA polymerase)
VPALSAFRANTREGVRVQRVYLTDDSKKRVVVATSERLKNPNFKASIDKEIAAFKDVDCIEEIRLADLEVSCNAVSTRWDFTIRKRMSETRFKARLVAGGYEDAEKQNISSDSPVASAAVQRRFLVACAVRQWKPHSCDFSTAFLKRNYMDRKCDIVIAPPEGNAAPGIAWQLKEPL